MNARLKETLDRLDHEWAAPEQSGAPDERLMLIALELRGIRQLLMEISERTENTFRVGE